MKQVLQVRGSRAGRRVGPIPEAAAGAAAGALPEGAAPSEGAWEYDEAERLSERLERENRRYAVRFSQ